MLVRVGVRSRKERALLDEGRSHEERHAGSEIPRKKLYADPGHGPFKSFWHVKGPARWTWAGSQK